MACGRKPTIKVGDIFTSNSGSRAEVVYYENINRVWVQFLDETEYVKCFGGSDLKRGAFKNPFEPSVYEKGYIGAGRFKTKSLGVAKDAYVLWKEVLRRCYDGSFHKSQPTYKDCSVDNYFLNFQNFAEWYYNHPDYIKNYQIDKDILVKGNKVYSKDTCCFVPQEINSIFRNRQRESNDIPIGVIKRGNRYASGHKTNGKTEHLGTFDTPEEAHQAWVVAKEKRARELAIKYQDKLDTRVYNILYNWKYEGNGFEY